MEGNKRYVTYAIHSVGASALRRLKIDTGYVWLSSTYEAAYSVTTISKG